MTYPTKPPTLSAETLGQATGEGRGPEEREMEFPGAPEDPEQRSFIDPVWLQQWGLGPENALDYFALSPFYDKACNNEQCRMQGVDLREGLLNLTGLE